MVQGRPLGTRKRRRFEQTRVGYILKWESTSEYETVMQAAPNKPSDPPAYELILAITKASADPIFKTKRFISALEDYRVNGLYTRPKPSPTKSQLAIYNARKKKMVDDMVWNNRFMINALMQ